MSTSHVLLKYTRLTHLYIGVFVSPAILFFAFTGAIQTFSLHETTKGSSYKPPQILVTLGQIHKKQTPIVPVRKQPPAAESAGPKRSEAVPTPTVPPAAAPSPQKEHNALPLKIFFLLVSISLFISTFSGIYMSYKYTRNKLVITSLLVLGAVIPVLMLAI